jgi:hypothetical protein
MNKGKDFPRLLIRQLCVISRHPKQASRAEGFPKKILTTHLLRCMSRKNQPGKKNKLAVKRSLQVHKFILAKNCLHHMPGKKRIVVDSI